MRTFTRITLVLAALLGLALGQPAAARPAILGDAPCDRTLWQHVYHASRLHVLAPCIAVRGTIVDATHGTRRDGLRHEKDGDTHGWLRVDTVSMGAGQVFAPRAILNDGNQTHEGGNLVFEVVCAFRVTQADAVSACRGYQTPIVIPPVGTSVEMVGAYVEDDNHAHWRELHPVSSITVRR